MPPEGDGKSLSSNPNGKHHYADISGVEPTTQRDKTEHKKYILKVLGKFSQTSHNG